MAECVASSGNLQKDAVGCTGNVCMACMCVLYIWSMKQGGDHAEGMVQSSCKENLLLVRGSKVDPFFDHVSVLLASQEAFQPRKMWVFWGCVAARAPVLCKPSLRAEMPSRWWQQMSSQNSHTSHFLSLVGFWRETREKPRALVCYLRDLLTVIPPEVFTSPFQSQLTYLHAWEIGAEGEHVPAAKKPAVEACGSV